MSRPRTHTGTGIGDTPERTWTEMRAAYANGESLSSLARRFGVLYSAVQNRANSLSEGRLWVSPKQRRCSVRGSPCCGRLLVHTGNTIYEPGLQTIHYECVGCRKRWGKISYYRSGNFVSEGPLAPDNSAPSTPMPAAMRVNAIRRAHLRVVPDLPPMA